MLQARATCMVYEQELRSYVKFSLCRGRLFPLQHIANMEAKFTIKKNGEKISKIANIFKRNEKKRGRNDSLRENETKQSRKISRNNEQNSERKTGSCCLLNCLLFSLSFASYEFVGCCCCFSVNVFYAFYVYLCVCFLCPRVG